MGEGEGRGSMDGPWARGEGDCRISTLVVSICCPIDATLLCGPVHYSTVDIKAVVFSLLSSSPVFFLSNV